MHAPSPTVRLLLPALLALGCASAPVPVATIPATRAPETRALPPDPAEEPLPPGTPAGEWVEPLEVGGCYDATGLHGGDTPCPRRAGILSSEARAVRDGFYRIRYRELRTFYEADRTTWSAQRELYEALRRQDQATITRMQPSWWDRNALPLGVAAGLVLGVGTMTAIIMSVR